MICRKCVGCGKIKERTALLKVVRIHDTGEVVVNPCSKQFGRSSYLCYNKECFKNALKKKRIQKALRKEISDSTIKIIENTLD